LKKAPDVSPKNTPDRGRFSARKKTKAVIRLLRGEDLDKLSRELGVTAATLASWRDQFVAGGQAHLKSRKVEDPDEEQVRRLQAKIGELTMDNELLQIRAERAEELVGRSRFVARRSRA